MDGGSARFRAGVREALAGGHRGRAGERAAARQIEALYAPSRKLVTAAWDFHEAAALWAVLEKRHAAPARAVIVTAAGLPRPENAGPPMLAAAVRAAPGARMCYVDADPETTWMRQVVMPGHGGGRVFAATAPEDEPEKVLEAAASAGVPADVPVSVHIVLAAQYWDGAKARDVLRRYAALLAPGSSVCLTAGDIAGSPAGDAYLSAVQQILGSTLHRHGREAIAGWIEDAGMRLHPQGVTDCRAFGRPGLQDELEHLEPVARVLEAVGIVPR